MWKDLVPLASCNSEYRLAQPILLTFVRAFASFDMSDIMRAHARMARMHVEFTCRQICTPHEFGIAAAKLSNPCPIL